MNILLTGGSGFIGKNIMESFLGKKYNILAPRHKDMDLINEDSVEEFFLKNKIDIVIHSACKPAHRNAVNPENAFYHNTRMFFNIIKNSGHYRKMIYLSSGSIYDMRYYIPKMKEEYFGTHIPEDEHGFSRYVSGKYIEFLDNIIELRLFGVFGKYEDYAIRFISNAICKTLFDLPITLKQNRRFDYLYINDLMPVLDYFIQNKPLCRTYNVTPDYSIELYSVAETIRSISEKNVIIKVFQDGMGMEYSGNNLRLHKEIRDLKFTPVDESIKDLYSWYSSNKHLINREVLLFDK